MLSAAKHLLYLVGSSHKQILRFAQKDMLGAFFQHPAQRRPLWPSGSGASAKDVTGNSSTANL
jgi:hypothetical protein